MGKRIASMLVLLPVIGLLVLGSGCASIVSKSVYPVSITSEPSQAAITVYNHKSLAIYEGKTPTTMDLKAGRGYFLAGDYTVKFTKLGYNDVTVPIKQKLDGWYVFGNILVGGLIGWVIVDPITGGMYTIEDVHATLQPLSSTTEPAPPAVPTTQPAPPAVPTTQPALMQEVQK